MNCLGCNSPHNKEIWYHQGRRNLKLATSRGFTEDANDRQVIFALAGDNSKGNSITVLVFIQFANILR